MRRLIVILSTAFMVVAMALSASAGGGHDKDKDEPKNECPGELTVPIDTVIRGKSGTQHLLAQVSVPAGFQGATASVSAQGENNSSVHPGNNLIVASNGTSVVLEDVEREAGVTTVANGTLTLGSDITISLVMGDDKVFSAGITVKITCEEEPPPPVEPESELTVGGSCVEDAARLSGSVTFTGADEGFAIVFIDDVAGPSGLVGPNSPFVFDIDWPSPGNAVTVQAGVDFGDGQSVIGDKVVVEEPSCEDTTTTTMPDKPTTTVPPSTPPTEPTTTEPPAVSSTTVAPAPSTTTAPAPDGDTGNSLPWGIPAGGLAVLVSVIGLAWRSRTETG